MTKRTNSLDASEGNNNSKRTDSSATIAKSSLDQADNALFEQFLRKFRDSRIYLSDLEPFFATLTPVKRDNIVKDYNAMAKMFQKIQLKQKAESKLIPSEDSSQSHIPNPLKNLKTHILEGSSDAKGELRFEQYQKEANTLHEAYVKGMTELYAKCAELELELKFKKLSEKFFSNLVKWALAEILTLRQNSQVTFKCNLDDRDLAGNAICDMISSGLNTEFVELLGFSERPKALSKFQDTFFPSGLASAEDSDGFDTLTLSKRVSKDLLHISTNFFKILSHLKLKKEEMELEASLATLYANEAQYSAQDEVREILTQEDEIMGTEGNEQLGALVDTKVSESSNALNEKIRQQNQQLKAMQKQISNLTRSKSLGGGTDQSLNAKSNGQKKNAGSTSSSKQQRKKQQSNQHNRHRNASQPGSGRGGRGRGSRRS